MFKWLGGGKSKQLSTEEVRDLVFAAVARGDGRAFQEACRVHEGLILTTFKQWAKVPEAVARDKQATDNYFQALVTTAEYFKSKGHPELLESLMAPDDKNPIEQMKKAALDAQRLSELRDYAASNKILIPMLRTMEQWKGSGVIYYRARMYGLLGTNYFRLQNHAEALRCTRQALADCQELNDEEGIRTYSENLRALGG
jgi:hypothetical protein